MVKVRKLAQSSDVAGDTGHQVEGWPSLARVMPHHPGRQPGQAWNAAAGGAGRRPARRRGRADASIARSAPPGAAAPLPRGHALAAIGTVSRRGAEGAVGAEGLPQSKHDQKRKALTCTFAPPAGLEPAPYGLEVMQSLSGWCCPDASLQVAWGSPSVRLGPGRGGYMHRIAKRIASPCRNACGLYQLTLQIVADYTRLSAVQAAGRAGHGPASGLQHPGVAEDCRPALWRLAEHLTWAGCLGDGPAPLPGQLGPAGSIGHRRSGHRDPLAVGRWLAGSALGWGSRRRRRSGRRC
jgi:hypothetical protein